MSDFLKQLQAKAYKIDLTQLPEKEKQEIKQILDSLKTEPLELSPETQAILEDAINNYRPRR